MEISSLLQSDGDLSDAQKMIITPQFEVAAYKRTCACCSCLVSAGVVSFFWWCSVVFVIQPISPPGIPCSSGPFDSGNGNLPDSMHFDEVLFAGTHNSAINLGRDTPLRSMFAQDGSYSSEAAVSYRYLVMDQRLSVRDQLSQGIRVIDLEVGAVSEPWRCESGSSTEVAGIHVENDRSLVHLANLDSGTTNDLNMRLSRRNGLRNMSKALIDLHNRSKRAGSVSISDSTSSQAECGGRCSQQRRDLFTHCLQCCPFIVSHGGLDTSIGLSFGYTFPEDIFEPMAEWVRDNPREIVALYLLVTHGNRAPSFADVVSRMNSSGLLAHVWNPQPGALHRFPTLGEMRRANRTVLVVTSSWGPNVNSSYVNSSGMTLRDPQNCVGDTPCMDGWDSASNFQQEARRAALRTDHLNRSDLFAIHRMASRRGRADNSDKYWPLPNIIGDFPFVFGGNPAQAERLNDCAHIRSLEARWSNLLAPFGMHPNWILVDFFNTSTPYGHPSRTLLPNPHEGLTRAVSTINYERAFKRSLPIPTLKIGRAHV